MTDLVAPALWAHAAEHTTAPSAAPGAPAADGLESDRVTVARRAA